MRFLVLGWSVLMLTLVLAACSPDEKKLNTDGDQLLGNDADGLSNDELIAKYSMSYIDGKLSFSLLEGGWCYVDCMTVTIAEVYYEGNKVGAINYDGGSGPECDVLGPMQGYSHTFSVTLDQQYSSIEVKMIFGCDYWAGNNCSFCEGRAPETVTLTNQ